MTKTCEKCGRTFETNILGEVIWLSPEKQHNHFFCLRCLGILYADWLYRYNLKRAPRTINVETFENEQKSSSVSNYPFDD